MSTTTMAFFQLYELSLVLPEISLSLVSMMPMHRVVVFVRPSSLPVEDTTCRVTNLSGTAGSASSSSSARSLARSRTVLRRRAAATSRWPLCSSSRAIEEYSRTASANLPSPATFSAVSLSLDAPLHPSSSTNAFANASCSTRIWLGRTGGDSPSSRFRKSSSSSQTEVCTPAQEQT